MSVKSFLEETMSIPCFRDTNKIEEAPLPDSNF